MKDPFSMGQVKIDKPYIVLVTEAGSADELMEFPDLRMASDFLHECSKHFKKKSYFLFQKGAVHFDVLSETGARAH